MVAAQNQLIEFHCRNNRSTRSNWQRFAEHRARVTDLALACGGDSLAVLGCGNCNDLDLKALVARFKSVHLVDIDRDATHKAWQRLPGNLRQRLAIRAPVDLSGCLPELAVFRSRPPTPLELALLSKNGVARILAALSQPYDAVISTCLLSQLMQGCFVGLGGSNPCLRLVACAVATTHLRSMVELLKPGGRGVLVTDVVSSPAYPLADTWGRVQPFELLKQIEATRQAQDGTDPGFVAKILAEDSGIADRIAAPTLVEPWLWHFNEDTDYLTYAVEFRRKHENDPR